MSNSMLNQAILDAKELKEAAIKNAGQVLIEKYSSEYEKEIEKLLEQADPMAPAAVEPMAPAPAGGSQPIDSNIARNDSDSKSALFDKLEYAFKDGEVIEDKIYPTGVVEIDLDSLTEFDFNKNQDKTPEQMALQELKVLSKKGSSSDFNFAKGSKKEDEETDDEESEDEDLDDEDLDDEESEEDEDLDDEESDEEESEEDEDLDDEESDDEESEEDEDLEDEDLDDEESDDDEECECDPKKDKKAKKASKGSEESFELDFDIDEGEDSEGEDDSEDDSEDKDCESCGKHYDQCECGMDQEDSETLDDEDSDDESGDDSYEDWYDDYEEEDDDLNNLETPKSKTPKSKTPKSKKIDEVIKLDYKRSGPRSQWTGVNHEEAEYDVELANLQSKIEEMEQETEFVKESNSKLNSKLKEGIKNSMSLINNLSLENKKLSNKIKKYEQNLRESRTMNYKLLYTNKVLSNSSLNERQKNKIAESINSARTSEEVKLLYGTLNNTMREGTLNSSPKSLSEAVERRSSTSILLKGSERTVDKKDDYAERMKRLAGII